MATTLKRNESYTRNEVHDIYAPDTSFTEGAGTWGLQGVVGIPDRPTDYVFFVTFGQSQGDHQFDEGITEEGVLTWQSQPSQGLDDKRVQSWIDHDDLKNNIHLFLRESKGDKYTYYGLLKYLTHDEDREKPVYFQWQIIDWDNENGELNNLSIPLQPPTSDPHTDDIEPKIKGLVEESPPAPKKKKGTPTRRFKGVKGSDFSGKEKSNKSLGKAGELMVLKMEQDRLRSEGLSHLADKVMHTSVVEGDGAGYDIKSYGSDEKSVRYLEVKTTRGSKSTPFYISPNELAFSQIHSDSFELVRVFAYDGKTESGRYFVLNGDMNEVLELEPTEYRATVGGASMVTGDTDDASS
jgi:hypothetical protein